MPWDDSDAQEGLGTIVDWMRSDIECMINGDANYAAALCILAYCEALGRLLKKTLGNPARRLGLPAFQFFLQQMGYSSAESQLIYGKLRHGMAHSYIPKRMTNFTKDSAAKGIDTSNPSDIKVHLLTLQEEFIRGTEFVLTEVQRRTIGSDLLTQFARNPSFDKTMSFSLNIVRTSGSPPPTRP